MTGKAAEEIGAQSMSTTYVFEQIRETIAGFAPPLLEFVGILPHLFDPFNQITSVFNQEGGFRDQANKFIAGFNKYIDAIDDVAGKYLSSADAEMQRMGNVLKGQGRARSAFAATADLLMGLSSDSALNKQLQEIKDNMGKTDKASIENFDPIGDASFLLKTLIESDFMKDIGEMLGTVAGGIARGVFDAITGMFNIITEGAGANKLLQGFTEGFGGMFSDIGMSGVMDGINKVLIGTFAKIGELIVTQGIPLIIRGLISAFFAGLKSGPIGLLVSGGLLLGAVKAVTAMTAAAYNAAASLRTLGFGGVGRTKGRAAAGLRGLFGKGKGMAAAGKDFFLGGVKGVKSGRDIFGAAKFGQAATKGGQMAMLGKTVSAGLKSGLKMGAIGGIVKAGFALADGKSPLDAISEGLASAGGSAIGAAIGTIIFPGIGTAIGGVIGGLLADTEPVISFFKGVLTGAGEAFKVVSEALGGMWDSISGIFGDLFSIFNELTGGAGDLFEGFNLLDVGVTVIRIALTPFVQLLNAIAVILAGLKLGMAQLRKFITNLNPLNKANAELQKEMNAEIHSAGQAFDTARQRVSDWNDNLFKGATGATQGLSILNEAALEAAAAMQKTQKIRLTLILVSCVAAARNRSGTSA